MGHWTAERWSDLESDTHAFSNSVWPQGGRGGGLCGTEHGFPAEGKAVANLFSRNCAKAVSLKGVLGTMTDVSGMTTNHRLSKFVRKS